ncbi:MAG: ECF-type sigma factor [Balneolaceae bacterium]
MEPDSITTLSCSIRASDKVSIDDLFVALYDELLGLARSELKKSRRRFIFDSESLLHEAYLKLVKHPPSEKLSDRKHFMMIVVKIMRQILATKARMQMSKRRGEGMDCLHFDERYYADSEIRFEAINLKELLTRLGVINKRQKRVLDCRYFEGYGIEQTAEILSISPATVKRDLADARSWLQGQIF